MLLGAYSDPDIESVQDAISSQVHQLGQDDIQAMDVINMLFMEEDYRHAFYYQNELARKLIVDAKLDLAKTVLENRQETS